MKEYILGLLEEEKYIVEELLRIDNKVQNTNYTYEYVYKTIYNFNKEKMDIKGKYMVITDGELSTVLNILFNYSDNILCLNINHKTVGLYKWLVNRLNMYNDNIDIILDIDNNYELYDKYDNFIIAGFDEFVDGTSEMYDNKNIIKIILD